MKWPLVVSLVLATCSTSQAGQFDGWCFPANACTETPSRIEDDRFSRCEDGCVMEHPVAVRGMRATLYDVKCTGDGYVVEFRMLMSIFEGNDNRLEALALGDFGALDLELCNDDGSI